MRFEAAAPLPDPVLLQARLAALTSMLETQDSAVKQLRLERDAFRAERDTANGEVEKLQLIIKQLMRSRYGAHSEKLDPDQLQLALEEVAQSLGLATSVVKAEPAADKQASASRRSATAAPCRRICRGSRWSSMSRTNAVRAVVAPCM